MLTCAEDAEWGQLECWLAGELPVRDDTANLVLEEVRALGAEMASLREETRASFEALNRRMDHLETELRGLTYMLTVSLGALLGDIADLKNALLSLKSADSPIWL